MEMKRQQKWKPWREKREERRQNKKINQRIERDKGIEVTNLEKEAMEEKRHKRMRRNYMKEGDTEIM